MPFSLLDLEKNSTCDGVNLPSSPD